MNSPANALTNIEQKEIVPGYRARMIHSDTVTLAYWDIDADSQLPAHHHHHEQILTMQSGEFELTLDGTPIHLVEGDILVIKSNVPHSGRAITDCKILDVFCPVREDYR